VTQANKRILFVHPGLAPAGGVEALTAVLLQGLLDHRDYRIHLAGLGATDFPALDAYFGTRLATSSRITVHQAPPHWTLLVRAMRLAGVRAAGVELSLLERWAQVFARRAGPFNLYVSTCNEWAFPDDAPTLSYIHYPRYHSLRGEAEIRWFHRLPGVLSLYRAFCMAVNQHDPARIRRATALANSHWTAQRYLETHGVPAAVVNPPVPTNGLDPAPWDARQNALVILGRITAEKRIPDIISLVEKVRAALPERARPGLHVVGSWGIDPHENQHVAEVCARHSSWVDLRIAPDRTEVDRLLSTSRYGIHGMRDEHFGMAVAEMQHAGCVAFVPATGGPPEIVGEEPRQIYSTDAEAVEKICAVISNPSLQTELHSRASSRREAFSIARFIREMLVHIDRLIQ
jgi:glycosyltransferase involved in cell wall biosynthesis